MLVPQLAAPGTFRQMELAMPEPQAGEVRVRIGAVSICGSDLSAYRGWHPRIRPPVVLGHESAGVVDAVGPDVRDVEIGTRVAVEPTLPCRECRYCRQGRANICIRYRVVGEGSDLPGAFAGHVVVPADRVHPLPDRVTLDEGA